MPIVGAFLFVGGILMVLCHRAVAIGFCRLGKWTWTRTDSPLAKSLASSMTKLYDETKAPRIILLLGMVLTVEGIVLWLLPTFIG